MPKTKTKTVRIDESNIILVGMVKPYAGETPPDKYLVCDGSVVSRTTYAELFSFIGTRWGNGDGSTTFHLPDLRGRFLRGYDAAAGRDPDSGSRSASNAGGNSGNNVGSVQGDGTRNPGFGGSSGGVSANHSHKIFANVSSNTALHVSGAYAARNSNVSNATEYTITGTNSGPTLGNTGNISSDHSHSISVSGGNAESRGINASVQYIIRVEK